MFHFFFLPFTFLLALSGVLAASNRTIDDQYGEVVYQPASAWNFGPTCSTCNIGPGLLNDGFIFDETWHDVTVGQPTDVVNMTLSFTGTAIYVYCIVPNNVSDTTTTVNLTASLDGGIPQPYLHKSDGTDTIQYYVPVFVYEGLNNTAHTLVVSPTAGPGGGTQDGSLLLFDYAIYTVEDNTSQSSASGSAGASSASTGPTQTTVDNTIIWDIPTLSSTPTTVRTSTVNAAPSASGKVSPAVQLRSGPLLVVLPLLFSAGSFFF